MTMLHRSTAHRLASNSGCCGTAAAAAANTYSSTVEVRSRRGARTKTVWWRDLLFTARTDRYITPHAHYCERFRFGSCTCPNVIVTRCEQILLATVSASRLKNSSEQLHWPDTRRPEGKRSERSLNEALFRRECETDFELVRCFPCPHALSIDARPFLVGTATRRGDTTTRDNNATSVRFGKPFSRGHRTDENGGWSATSVVAGLGDVVLRQKRKGGGEKMH